MIEEDVLQEKMLSDIEEITSMVNAAIGFLRDGMEQEQPASILLVTLIESICDDYVDIGENVSLTLPLPLVATVRGTVFDPRPRAINVKFDRQITRTCQPNRLRRAFTNLIENALKYGQWARVSIDATADEIIVRIVDGGSGLPKEELEQVFEPFYRVDGSRSRATGGVGLRLSVAKSVNLSHGGKINLFKYDRYGLEVRVTFPRTSSVQFRR